MSRTKPEGTLRLEANGHVLVGRRRKGVWNVRCPTLPELEGLYSHHLGFIALFLGLSESVTVSPVTVRKE